MAERPSPHELWVQAGREVGQDGQGDRYAELLREHGYIVPIPPCPTCGRATNHRHERGLYIPTDIFGHDRRPIEPDRG